MHLQSEINVTGRVNDVDAVLLPEAGRRGRRDGDAALALLHRRTNVSSHPALVECSRYAFLPSAWSICSHPRIPAGGGRPPARARSNRPRRRRTRCSRHIPPWPFSAASASMVHSRFGWTAPSLRAVHVHVHIHIRDKLSHRLVQHFEARVGCEHLTWTIQSMVAAPSCTSPIL